MYNIIIQALPKSKFSMNNSQTHTLNELTGSSKASDSPLLLHNQPTPVSPTRTAGSNGNASTTSAQPQPYLYPKVASTTTEFRSGEPVFGEIKHADAKFIGKICYVPVKDVSPEREGEGEQQASATSEDGKCEVLSI